MSAILIDGKKVAEDIRAELRLRIERLKNKGITPNLTVILVGEDPASQVYVSMKKKACEALELFSETIRLPAQTTQEELVEHIERLNQDPSVHGILVQMPLPSHINSNQIIEVIHPRKDVDGFHPINVGRLVAGTPSFLPCTPAGVIELLTRYGYTPDGKHVVIVGRSNIVGKPLANLLIQKTPAGNATVTVCHTHTKNLSDLTRQADILIAAAGRPRTITGDMVKKGVVVIDVGVNRVDDPTQKRGYHLEGDVDFASVSEKAAAITPVPGGVGPMTIVMLMKNTVQAAEEQSGLI
ncbi:MAG: bifunctional methylenetetrahydrofolate dehydrogenase/methenyltetrahydrofolate cyclohydrolase FolD [Calditrichaeota bacterium]|nr:bifunctional methylenetetrahydrofolate dehydrogenase/methenyltetrahydrofolate cyclohydrolase FolD [Calditrichota bacterium]